MWPDIHRRIRPEPEPNGVMAAPLLYMLMKCMMLRNLCINCSVLMSVIYDLRRCCLFECQSVLTNDLELTRFYDIHAAMLL